MEGLNKRPFPTFTPLSTKQMSRAGVIFVHDYSDMVLISSQRSKPTFKSPWQRQRTNVGATSLYKNLAVLLWLVSAFSQQYLSVLTILHQDFKRRKRNPNTVNSIRRKFIQGRKDYPFMMPSVKSTLQAWNNYPYDRLTSQWKFVVLDKEKPVGYVLDTFVQALYWDKSNFQLTQGNRTIRLNPGGVRGKPTIADCNRALDEFCYRNQGLPAFAAALRPWCATKTRGHPANYHPVLTSDRDLKGLKVPSPVRGILGIETAGVHLNVYSVRIENGIERVDKIWVSQRSLQATFPSCYDQPVAGAMDPEDCESPTKTLRHEAEEEAGWELSPSYDAMLQSGSRQKIGQLANAGTMYFCMKKDSAAGVKEVGHIESGVRFCFDLKLRNGIIPTPNAEDKCISRFFPLSIEETIASIKKKQWKPSSGLVMIKFLRQHGCIDDRDLGENTLHIPPPFDLPAFSA